MATSWNGQMNPGNYRIQFETTNKDLYKLVENACKMAMDKEYGKKSTPRVDRFYNWTNEMLNG